MSPRKKKQCLVGTPCDVSDVCEVKLLKFNKKTKFRCSRSSLIISWPLRFIWRAFGGAWPLGWELVNLTVTSSTLSSYNSKMLHAHMSRNKLIISCDISVSGTTFVQNESFVFSYFKCMLLMMRLYFFWIFHAWCLHVIEYFLHCLYWYFYLTKGSEYFLHH